MGGLFIQKGNRDFYHLKEESGNGTFSIYGEV
jgi:hypothetical protein